MTNTHKELSIQITLSGFSFQIDSPEGKLSGAIPLYDFDSVLSSRYNLSCNIEWSVPRVMIVPFDLFDHSCVDHYLLSAGMMQRGVDRSMFAVRGEFVAVWAIDNSLFEYLEQRIPQAEHSHPLLSVIAMYNNVQNAVVIDIDNSNLMHIAIWNEAGLYTAISTEIQTDEDVLYFCRRLSKTDEMLTYKVICEKGVNLPIVELLAQYYKNVTTAHNR